MEQDRIKVSVGATKKLGNYETVRVDIGAESTVLETETREQKREELFAECMEFLSEAIKIALEEL